MAEAANRSPTNGPRTTVAIHGARVHNLKDISLEIPRDRLVVVTGLSGSGKSSLAFDTLYAEGQRLLDWYAELAGCYGDEERKLDLGRRILSQWVDECYIVGIARKTEIAIVSNRFGNMPDTMIQSWRLMTPGYLGPEQFYIDETPGADLRAGRTGPAGTQKQTPSTR